jgi:hypothetical protein
MAISPTQIVGKAKKPNRNMITSDIVLFLSNTALRKPIAGRLTTSVFCVYLLEQVDRGIRLEAPNASLEATKKERGWSSHSRQASWQTKRPPGGGLSII